MTSTGRSWSTGPPLVRRLMAKPTLPTPQASVAGQRLGPDALGYAFGLGAAEAEAAEPDGVAGRDVHAGDAGDGVRGGRGRRRGPRGDGEREDAGEEARRQHGCSCRAGGRE